MQDNPEKTEYDSFYQTGPTQPEKSNAGPMSLVLMLVILLGGMMIVMEMMDFSILPEAKVAQPQDSASLEFSLSVNEPEVTARQESDTVSMYTVPQAEGGDTQGISLKEVYADNIDSVVSITSRCLSGTTSGMGVVLTKNGYVVTNAHVVADSLGVTVDLTDGRSFPATVVGSDYLTDLAVLYISAEDLTPAKLGDSSALQEGEKVAGLGSSLALSGTVGGTVSDVSREITFEGRTMVMIQTNLVLPEGSAGSPLLNSSGQVVGINALQTDTNSTDADPGCFAIPSVTVKEVTQELIRQGYVSGRPSLGFSTHTLSALEQQFFRLPKGVYITRVDSDSPAYQVGIRPGDTLLQVNGQAITTTQELMSLVYTLSPGDRAEVVFYRSGWRYTADILVIENQGN